MDFAAKVQEALKVPASERDIDVARVVYGLAIRECVERIRHEICRDPELVKRYPPNYVDGSNEGLEMAIACCEDLLPFG